ncbi:MAG: hypothetical protein DMF63_07300 [Acidobacteria bacterium]|nr:MAG: hypothetical protein DMF63_07300 [Acidobacteriota bacterium]
MNWRTTKLSAHGPIFCVAALVLTAAIFLSVTPTGNTVIAESKAEADGDAGLPAATTFNANPASLGSIPDHVGACQTGASTPRDVTFNVIGLDGAVNNVELSMLFGAPVHTFVGDITATLKAPNGFSRTIFGRTGATTATGTGDSSDLAGPYVFKDVLDAPTPNGGWWQTATVVVATAAMTPGQYRVTDSGGAGETDPQPARSMNGAFTDVANANGTWTLSFIDGCAGDTGAVSAASLTLQVIPDRKRADFDGDRRSDLSVFRPTDGNWYVNKSTEGFSSVNWGLPADIPAPGDFDGDNREDMVIFRPSTGTWWILRSTGGTTAIQFGTNGDIPIARDYDGDSITDLAVFRPSNNFWYIKDSSTGGTHFLKFGQAGDMPVPSDYSGDGEADMAVYRPSNGSWWINYSSNGSLRLYVFGNSTDKPVPADYDGDNKTDIAIFRPSNGQWWTLPSTTFSPTVVTFGVLGDIPVPGDYDGDDKDDQAIYRNGVWWLNRSTAGITAQSFGVAGDIPIPSKYIP